MCSVNPSAQTNMYITDTIIMRSTIIKFNDLLRETNVVFVGGSANYMSKGSSYIKELKEGQAYICIGITNDDVTTLKAQLISRGVLFQKEHDEYYDIKYNEGMYPLVIEKNRKLFELQ